MSHTPGPWTRTAGERFRHDNSAGIRAASGMYIATALDLNRTDRDEEVEANARLIAAAPDLLAALKAFVADEPNARGYVLRPAYEAIDKAEGTS